MAHDMKTATDELRMYLKAMAFDLQSPNPFKSLDEKQAIVEKYAHEIAEQAIAVTLGRGTCIVTHGFNCSNCGKQIGVVRNCEMYETCDGRQEWKSLDHEVCDVPNYCPNCGAKVVERF